MDPNKNPPALEPAVQAKPTSGHPSGPAAGAPAWAQGSVAWPFRAAPSLSARSRKQPLPRQKP